MNRSFCVISGAVVAALTAGFPNAALAQTVPAPIASPVETAASSEPISAADAGDGVKEVVVTARRRNETIQQTPVAITAIAPAQM